MSYGLETLAVIFVEDHLTKEFNMTKNQFLRWAASDGQLCTADGWKYIQIHKLESAFSEARAEAAPWPGIIARNLCRLIRMYDVSVSFTVHDKKPTESFKECNVIEDRDREPFSESNKDDSYGTKYIGGLFSWASLEWNIMALERFINEAILANRDREDKADSDLP